MLLRKCTLCLVPFVLIIFLLSRHGQLRDFHVSTTAADIDNDTEIFSKSTSDSFNSTEAPENAPTTLKHTILQTVKYKIENVTYGYKESLGLDTNKTFFSGSIESFQNKLNIIFPGTKWCGKGSTASSEDHLGRFKSADICCREHDMCPDYITSGDTKFGLVNSGLIVRSHCDCDRRFFACLKDSHDLVSAGIGYTYFTIMNMQCFDEDFPVTGCEEMKRGRCVKYFKDESSEKVYQWFDNPRY